MIICNELGHDGNESQSITNLLLQQNMEILCENRDDKKKDEITNKDKKRKKLVQDNFYDKKKDEMKNEDKKREKNCT